jgi:predicted aconitase with swiveling domain
VTTLAHRCLVPGSATGEALVSHVPISLWGGLDPETGEVIDRRHPLSGSVVMGRWLVVPHGRGSCSASGVFLEAAHNGRAACGVIVSQPDPILGLGAILADEILGIQIPMLHLELSEWSRISTGAMITYDGLTLSIQPVGT